MYYLFDRIERWFDALIEAVFGVIARFYPEDTSMAQYAFRINKLFSSLSCRPDEPCASFTLPPKRKSGLYLSFYLKDSYPIAEIRKNLLEKERMPWGIERFFALWEEAEKGKEAFPQPWRHVRYVVFLKDIFISSANEPFAPAFSYDWGSKHWYACMLPLSRKFSHDSIAAAVADRPPKYGYNGYDGNSLAASFRYES